MANTAPRTLRYTYRDPMSEGVHVYNTYQPWLDVDDDKNIFFASVQGYGRKSIASGERRGFNPPHTKPKETPTHHTPGGFGCGCLSSIFNKVNKSLKSAIVCVELYCRNMCLWLCERLWIIFNGLCLCAVCMPLFWTDIIVLYTSE